MPRIGPSRYFTPIGIVGVALTRVKLEKRSTKGGVPSKFISDHTDQLEPLNGIMVIEKEFSAAYTD